ncbi:MAG: hypothetical protein GTO14_06385 [Anaerolineales bacterium]|nr:hypothetical protein [Anaerolineales bacterium]
MFVYQYGIWRSIALHYLEGAVYINGMPGKLDWYANLVTNPEFTFHLKQRLQANIPARAIPITDETLRRKVLPGVFVKWGRKDDIESFIKDSPLI